MQAQDYAMLWAIGLGLPNAAEMSIEQAIADGAIIHLTDTCTAALRRCRRSCGGCSNS